MRQPIFEIMAKRRLRQRKREFINRELGGKCAICGSITDLQVDHPNNDRQYSAGITTKSWTFIKEEIKGCRLLCILHNASEGAKYRYVKNSQA